MMKRNYILVPLSLFLLLAVALCAGCTKKEPTLLDLTPEEAIEQVLSHVASELDTADGEPRYADLQAEATIRSTVDINGTKDSTSMTARGGYRVAGDDFRVDIDLFDLIDMTYTYTDGVLYMHTDEGRARWPMTHDDLAEMKQVLSADMGEVETTALPTDLPAIEEIFATIEMIATPAETDTEGQTVPPETETAADGTVITPEETVTITARGIKTDALDTLVPKLAPLLESLGLVTGYEITEDFDIIESEEILHKNTRSMLEKLDGDHLTLTVTATVSGILQELELRADIVESETQSVEFGGIKYEETTTYTTAIRFTVTADFSGKTVDAPAGYPQMHWRKLFGYINMEAMGLVPDGNGVIPLSDDPATWAEQFTYITDNPAECSGHTFRALLYTTGRVKKNTDGTYTVYLHPAEGRYNEAYTFRISATDYEATTADGLFTHGRPWSHLSVSFSIVNKNLCIDGWEVAE